MRAQTAPKPLGVVAALVLTLFVVAPQPWSHPGRSAVTVAFTALHRGPAAGPLAVGARGARSHVGGVGLVDIATRLPGALGAGTGIVLDGAGVVVTNNHVVSGATGIVATDPSDGRTYPADVVGADPRQDVAVLRLRNASGLPVAVLGDSDSVEVGDQVEAIGNAGGRGGSPTVTTGQVVALGRSVVAQDEFRHLQHRLRGMIEVDASVQPGDSGGPLVGTDGVIGMDTAAGGQSGFAIPINVVMAAARRLAAAHPPASHRSPGRGGARPPAALGSTRD